MAAEPGPLSFFAEGTPAPQGSKTLGRTRGGRPIILEGRDSSQRARITGWRNAVVLQASAALGRAGRRTPMLGPVGVDLLFIHNRPKSTPAGQRWRTKTPDLDKLARSTLDALKIAGAFGDDNQVAELVARKVLSHPHETPGVHITIRPLDHAEAP